ncbi:MAG: hypothetical protein JNM82_06155 [Rhodocyclaceae bacterium]|nr:hypothetical protein [Rhodocyclaceae bacterium]
MSGYWRHPTPVGVAKIEKSDDKWRVVLGDQDLGAFATPEQALAELVGGRLAGHGRCPDTRHLALPDSLQAWMFIPARWAAA